MDATAARLKIRLGDSTELRASASDGHDLLVTSPPYGDNTSTVPYGQYSYLPLQWIDLHDIDESADSGCLRSTCEIDNRSLGGHKKNAVEEVQHLLDVSPSLEQTLRRLAELPADRARRVAAFCRDLDASLRVVLTALRPCAYMVWTIGNRRVGGRQVPTDAILEELLAAKGVHLITRLERKIPNKRMATRNGIAKTMRDEAILLFRKGQPRGVTHTLTFDINAAVVFRLGEELITDVVQALVELVKNSYDADATWVKVTIDTHARNKWGESDTNTTGVILVEDDGHGMDRATIDRGWLTIANSPKREQKAAGQTTARGRTPIGDKGLGRLGSQRLARNVAIITRPRSEPTIEHHVAFSWADFRETASLHEVPVTWRRRTASGSKYGTKLILSDLCEPKTWQGEDNLRDLQRNLSGMISPFEETRDFRVHLEVDGKRIELTEIAERVRETAVLRYILEFDGEVFRISGVVRLTYLQPKEKDNRQFFQSLCRRDRGEALYEFLATKAKKRRPPHFEFSARPEWFIEFGTQRTLEDLGGVRRVDNSVANPGPFRGEVDAVALNRPDLTSDVLDRQSEYRRLVRDLAGIRVYRNGFGVRVGGDWLGLGKQWTGASSYYGLRPGNVLGYVAIGARDNPDLVETTSREGFQVTPHYLNFVDLLSEFVRFAGNSQEYLRRGVLQFLNEHRDRKVGVEPEDAHSKITQRIDDIADSLASEKLKVEGHGGLLRRVAAGASVAETEKMLTEVSSTLDRASELKSMRKVLDRRWGTLKDEVSALYESISLGLTAEALAHEITQHCRPARKEEFGVVATSQNRRTRCIDYHIRRARPIEYCRNAEATRASNPLPALLAGAERPNRRARVDPGTGRIS